MSDTITPLHHPYADLIGLSITSRTAGECTCEVAYNEKLLNPNQVIHGGVIYSMADTSMGGAVHSVLREGESCATIEIKITYLLPAKDQNLSCKSRVLKKGRRVAMLESEIFCGDTLIAKASGSFAIFS